MVKAGKVRQNCKGHGMLRALRLFVSLVSLRINFIMTSIEGYLKKELGNLSKN